MTPTAEEYAQAVWEYVTRTLASGTPDTPTNRQELYAEAVWEYVTRELTSGNSVLLVNQNQRRLRHLIGR